MGPVKKGTIVVSYPPGAICTVTNGSKTYKALNTSGAAAFVVDPGEWVVRAYGTGGDVSENVTVTAGGWVSATLNFWQGEVYDRGNEYLDFTGGIGAYPAAREGTTGTGKGTLTKNANSITLSVYGNDIAAATENKLDLSNFATLAVNITSTNAGGNRCALCVWSERDKLVSMTYLGATAGKVTLDVSSLDGSYYVGVGLWAAATVSYTLTFDEIRLS